MNSIFSRIRQRVSRARLTRIAVLASACLGAPLPGLAQEQWSPATSGVTADLRSVAYGGGVFVAVGADGTILRSTDYGQTWQDRTDVEVAGEWLVDVAYGNGVFLVSGGGVVLVSENQGQTWRRTGDVFDQCGGLAFGNSRWVAAGEGAIHVSTSNGASWTPVYDPLEGDPQGTDVIYASGQNTFLVVGGSIQVSDNGGQSFADVGNDASNWLTDAAYGNGVWVAIGGVFGNTVFHTSDPAVWPLDGLTELAGIDGLDGIAFGNGKFVITAGEGKLFVSEGSGAWRAVSSGVAAWLKGAAYGDGTFVVVGDGGTIITSGRPPEINSPLTASGTVGQAFSYQITALYGPTGFQASGLPQPLSINPSTGLITGIPSAAGSFQVTLLASNPHGSDSRQLTLTIQPAGSGGDFRVDIRTAVELEWPTKVGRSYQVQASPDLQSWTNYEAPTSGTGQMMYRLYSTRDPARRFYRVLEQ
jgi:hypothetical protein